MSSRTIYEDAFARLVGAPTARAFAMGRHGLVVALRAMGISPGDRVGVCGYTCLSVVEAVRVAGGQPFFLDVDERLCIAPASLANLAAGQLKALIVQHTFGLPGQLAAILEQAKRMGLPVIEDCCHALGSVYRGRSVGSLGLAAVYSSQWGKSYSTGQGGMLTVRDRALLEAVDDQIRQIAQPTSLKSDLSLAMQRGALRLAGGRGSRRMLRSVYHRLATLGVVHGSFAKELDFRWREGYVRLAGTLTSRAGLACLPRWPAQMEIRKRNAALIRDALASAGLAMWDPTDPADPVLLRYPVRVNNKPSVLARAAAEGLDLAGWYDSPVHPLEGEELEQAGYQPGQCPHVEAAIGQVVHLPTGSEFSPKQLARAICILRGSGLGG